jgi:hypothetical protein
MPRGIDDVVHFEEKDDQYLTRRQGGGGKGSATYHGTGESTPDEKTNIAMYFDEIDETLMKEGLANEHVPLLLAGVEYMIPIYKGVSRYQHIWTDPLTGNHEHQTADDIYQAAMEIMKPYFTKRVDTALRRYGNLSGTALTSVNPIEIIAAAFYGRVSTLMLANEHHLWGTFDEATGKVHFHAKQHDADVCLADKAAVKTIMNGGEVFFMKKEKMPSESGMAAVLRYEA